MSKENYKRLGNYITPYSEKNTGLKVQLSQGINNNKYFQEPRQVAVDSENDQIVHNGQFAYNKATTRNGEKISIAYREGPDCTVSAAYQVFQITDENQLDPHYLMLWFKRPEFDRYARFKSFGSAHEFFTWEEMCDVYLPVPDIEEQRKIVDKFHTIEKKISCNNSHIDSLKKVARTLYIKSFIENIDEDNLPTGWRVGKIADIAHVYSGKSITNKVDKRSAEYSIPVAGASGIIGYTNKSNHNQKLMTTGRVGTLGVVNKYYEPMWAADNVIVVISDYYEFVYQILTNLDYNILTKLGVQSLITKTGVENYRIIIPSESDILQFQEKVDPIGEYIRLLEQENNILDDVKKILLSQLT